MLPEDSRNVSTLAGNHSIHFFLSRFPHSALPFRVSLVFRSVFALPMLLGERCDNPFAKTRFDASHGINSGSSLVHSIGRFTASIGIRAGSFACSAAYFVLADFPHPDPSLAPHL